MKNKYFSLALGVLLAAGMSSACRSKTTPRNVILMTLDTLRADHVGAITPGGAATPNLDALAGRGTLFKNCYSLIPITLPSHASIFYSQPPHLLKNYNNAQSLDLKKDLPSLAPLFKERGFATAAFVSLGVVRASFGLNKGFMTYVDDFPPDRWYLRAGEVNGRVFPWLESHKDKPFFLWVHYSDPHEPYTPPGAPDDLDILVNGRRIGSYCLSNYTINTAELPLTTGDNEIRLEVKNDSDEFPYHARFDLYKLESPDESGLKIDRYRDFFFHKEDQTYFFKRTAAILVSNAGKPRSVTMTFRGKLIQPMTIMRENYRREVEYMDAEIGRFWARLKDLGLDQNTAIVAAGDHGEGLGEYLTEDGIRYYGHIHFLQDAFLKVPLIIYDPAAPKHPAVREEFVTLLDIAPSIMDIMGWKSPSRFLGRDLLKLEKGAPMNVFEETFKPEAWRDKFGLLAFPWHLIFTPEKEQIEVYDLTKDPDEHDDLFVKGNLPDAVIALRRKLEARAREVAKTKEAVRVNKKDEDMLRSLGYIDKK